LDLDDGIEVEIETNAGFVEPPIGAMIVDVEQIKKRISMISSKMDEVLSKVFECGIHASRSLMSANNQVQQSIGVVNLHLAGNQVDAAYNYLNTNVELYFQCFNAVTFQQVLAFDSIARSLCLSPWKLAAGEKLNFGQFIVKLNQHMSEMMEQILKESPELDKQMTQMKLEAGISKGQFIGTFADHKLLPNSDCICNFCNTLTNRRQGQGLEICILHNAICPLNGNAKAIKFSTELFQFEKETIDGTWFASSPGTISTEKKAKCVVPKKKAKRVVPKKKSKRVGPNMKSSKGKKVKREHGDEQQACHSRKND